jgi:hypothetical protein
MAIRPVDLQQAIVKAPDVTRDATVQQQAATAQQAHMAHETKRQADRAETVAQFEEAGAVLIRERQARGGEQQDQQQQEQDEPEGEASAEEAAAKAAAQAKLGRHVDLQA